MELVYDVQKRVVAAAYYSWRRGQSRRRGIESDKFFVQSIKGILTLRGATASVQVLPGHKNTWNDWKSLDQSKTVALTKEVCLAIKTVTGHDVTPGHLLAREYNSTELVTIASEPQSRVVSNAPNGDGHEQHEVSCERVAFRRSRTLRVEASWCTDEGRRLPKKQAIREVGSAIVGLRRAEVHLEAEGPINPLVTLEAPDKGDPNARAEGVRITDDPVNPGRWIVEAADGEVLVGSVDLTRIALAWHPVDKDMHLNVEADQNDFEVDFRPIGEWPAKTEAEQARSNMRRHFIANILRLRCTKDRGEYIISRAPVTK